MIQDECQPRLMQKLNEIQKRELDIFQGEIENERLRKYFYHSRSFGDEFYFRLTFLRKSSPKIFMIKITCCLDIYLL